MPSRHPLEQSCSPEDRKSTRLNSSHSQNLVCRLLLEKKKNFSWIDRPFIRSSRVSTCAEACYHCARDVLQRWAPASPPSPPAPHAHDVRRDLSSSS